MATPASADLLAKFEVGQDSADLYAKFEAQTTKNLYAKFIVRQPASNELKATFHVGQDSADLKAILIVKNANTEDLLSYFILINDTGVISQGIDAATLQALGIIS